MLTRGGPSAWQLDMELTIYQSKKIACREILNNALNLYRFFEITETIESGGRHVTRMTEVRNAHTIWVEDEKERSHSRNNGWWYGW